MAKKSYLWLILILGLALGLRLINLGQSFWLDEAAQAVMSSKSIHFIWFGRGGDFHPPLFYVMAHYWLLLGRSEQFLRVLPVAFGLLNVWLVYIFAGKLFPAKFSGVIAACLLAINPYHIYYSQEFRAYSLLCLLGTASMYFYYTKKTLWLSIINALLLYTHYSSSFLLLSQFIYWFVMDRKHNPKYIYSFLFSLLLYVPWLPQLAVQLHSGLEISQTIPGWANMLSVAPLKILPMTIFKITAGRITFLNKYLYGAYIVSVLGIFFFGVLLAKFKRNFLYTWVFLPVFIMMAVSIFLPQNQPFRVIFVLPAIVLLFTQACLRFPKLFITLVIYISLVGNISYYTRPRLQREQWRQAINMIKDTHAMPIVEFPGTPPPFSWYAPKLTVISSLPVIPAQTLVDNHNVLLLEYLSPVTDPAGNADKSLRQAGFSISKTHNFEGVGFIWEYSK